MQASVSANPSRTVLAAALSLIDSSSSAASPAFLPHASRDFRAWIAFNMHATAFRLVMADLALAMSHVNSEPRGAPGFATPARLQGDARGGRGGVAGRLRRGGRAARRFRPDAAAHRGGTRREGRCPAGLA